MENVLSFFEIPVSDFKRGVKFYSYIFGYKLRITEVAGKKMAFFPVAKNGVRGVLVQGKGYTPDKNGAIPYISYTEDINNILSRVTTCGGEVIVPPKTALFGAEGKFAMFIDTEGNRIGIYRNYLD